MQSEATTASKFAPTYKQNTAAAETARTASSVFCEMCPHTQVPHAISIAPVGFSFPCKLECSAIPVETMKRSGVPVPAAHVGIGPAAAFRAGELHAVELQGGMRHSAGDARWFSGAVL